MSDQILISDHDQTYMSDYIFSEIERKKHILNYTNQFPVDSEDDLAAWHFNVSHSWGEFVVTVSYDKLSMWFVLRIEKGSECVSQSGGWHSLPDLIMKIPEFIQELKPSIAQEIRDALEYSKFFDSNIEPGGMFHNENGFTFFSRTRWTWITITKVASAHWMLRLHQDQCDTPPYYVKQCQSLDDTISNLYWHFGDLNFKSPQY